MCWIYCPNRFWEENSRHRIEKIFDRVKKEKKNAKIFDPNDTIKLNSRTLSYIVSEIQKYSLLNTRIDIKGKAYEEIVGANLRGDRGEFFTPRNVMAMVVEMINPTIDEKVLDSSCGFYVIIMLVVKSLIKSRVLVLIQTFKTLKYNNLCVV